MFSTVTIGLLKAWGIPQSGTDHVLLCPQFDIFPASIHIIKKPLVLYRTSVPYLDVIKSMRLMSAARNF